MKKTICIVLTVLTLLSVCFCPVFAAGKSATDTALPKISAGRVTGKAGDTVSVPVRFENNPGLIAAKIKVSYDPDVLRLTGASDGEIFGDNNSYFGNRLSENPYTLMWEDALAQSDHTADGTAAVLYFKIADNAYGKNTAVKLEYDKGSTFNTDLDEVAFETQNGKVSVASKTNTGTVLRISGDEGSFEKQVKWWKKYSTAEMQLKYAVNDRENISKVSWSSDSSRVSIDQNGKITNSGAFARTAKITLTAYDKNNKAIADTSVTVRFYKFSWQHDRLQSQSVVSDNVFRVDASESETESETFFSFLTALFTESLSQFMH